MTDVIITQADPVAIVIKDDSTNTIDSISQGPQGISAYQVALSNGFIGTESDWLSSLVGPAGSSTYTKIASQPISGHRVISIGSDGSTEYASPTDRLSINKIAGLSLNAAGTGGTLNLIRMGEVTEPSWNLNTNNAVYLADNGTLTQTIPNKTSADYLLVVGFPTSSNSLFVNFGIPIELI